jgi:two-component system, OmpR family, alkaline phosphatase synthesis response regulator PhoP
MRERLLLVDDDADVLTALETLLEDAYEVVVAEDGDEALARLRQGGFDCVLLDLMMPRVSGATVLRAMRAEGVDVPVILGSASVDLTEQARELGADDSIQKPYDVEVLESKIARLSSRSEERRGRGLRRAAHSRQ